MATNLNTWGLTPDAVQKLSAEQRAMVLSLLNRILEEGRNWERFKWCLQVILPSRFEGVGGSNAAVQVNNTIKISVEEHKALKADYAKFSEQADRLLNDTNGETH